MAEFLRAPGRVAARPRRDCTGSRRRPVRAAALLDAAAFVVTLAGDDADLAVLARAGCFGGEVFDPRGAWPADRALVAVR